MTRASSHLPSSFLLAGQSVAPLFFPAGGRTVAKRAEMVEQLKMLRFAYSPFYDDIFQIYRKVGRIIY